LTETAVLEQEQAADPLDEAIADLESAAARLRRARIEGGDPAALDARAALVSSLANDLMRLPLRLLREAHECNAEAAAMRAAEDAAGTLRDAAEALADAETALAATAEPEQAAARTAITARQLAEQAADALKLAEQGNAEPAELAELHGRARDAAAVLEHETRKLTEAPQVRQGAKDALDRARAGHRKAQDDLRAAEEAAAHPTAAPLTRAELFDAYMFSFPVVLFGDEKLTADQVAVCRYHACAVVDDFGWTPPKAETRIRNEIAREMIATARQGRAVEISDGRGTVRLVANPLEMMGASQVATVAQGR
jgi:hypothetical protein